MRKANRMPICYSRENGHSWANFTAKIETRLMDARPKSLHRGASAESCLNCLIALRPLKNLAQSKSELPFAIAQSHRAGATREHNRAECYGVRWMRLIAS